MKVNYNTYSKYTFCLLLLSSVDATYSTTLGRFVNDNRKCPNTLMKIIEVNDRPHLCLFAKQSRLIREGEEITYNYADKGPNMFWREVRQALYTFLLCFNSALCYCTAELLS